MSIITLGRWGYHSSSVVSSWLSVWSVLVDQLLDIELSDEVLDNWVFEVDVGDLNFGLFWDEIHLSFSFLLIKNTRSTYSNSLKIYFISRDFVLNEI